MSETKHKLADPETKNSVAGISIESLPEEEQALLEGATVDEEASILGQGGQDTSDWDAPALTLSPSDKLIRKGNCGIRLGKDRDGARTSGEGGAGSSKCAAIDIVAGHMGWLAKKRNKRGKVLYADPDFRIDAARIYISQKSDVDGYFSLVPGSVGNTNMHDLRSTVAIKADTVRIIGRGATDNKYTKGYGIDLIAMNDDKDMQPLVKGDNLRECLTGIVAIIQTINNTLGNFF